LLLERLILALQFSQIFPSNHDKMPAESSRETWMIFSYCA
jgi:hypothetical protein